MPKHIGIVAVSAEGAALCCRTVCVEGASMLGRHAHPEVTLHTYPLAAYMSHIEEGRWDEVASMLLASAEKLRQAGADLLICTEIPLLMGGADSPLPTLDSTRILARAALREAVREDVRCAEP